MICPLCQLENPAGTTRCDCGYDFVGPRQDDSTIHLRQIAESTNVIKWILVFWTIASIVAGILWAVGIVKLTGDIVKPG